MKRTRSFLLTLVVSAALSGGCGGSTPAPSVPKPPAPAAASSAGAGGGATTTAPPADLAPPVAEPPIVSVPNEPPITADPYAGQPPEAINKLSPLKPVFFAYDSDQLDETARQALGDDAQILKKYPTWVVTIEGHSDERGTAEYNLALGERRALSARSYLLSLGLPADRFRTVSYGKEFPFDPGHDETAWAKNRRAHLVVTANK